MSDAVQRLQFVAFHSPGLHAADYRITVRQEVLLPSSAPGGAPAAVDNDFTATRTFTVSSERFSLAPAEVHAVFPPDGSVGDHSNVLPHVILERSTLPWERAGDPGDESLPWLAVLLFAEDEAPEVKTVTVADLVPAVAPERGQTKDDRVSVIDVPRGVLEAVAPTAAELKLQAHVRVGLEGDVPTGEGVAVLLGNRLPAPGARSVAHLVSVEERYSGGAFAFGEAGAEDPVRLVSLASWSFACPPEGKDFKGLLVGLDRDPAVPRLPSTGVDEADWWVKRGYVLLPHAFRDGGRSVAWYRGPLVPAANPVELEDPVTAADALVRYDAGSGVFDVSYAAAWQVGRMLALQSRDLSVALYRWKRDSSQQLRGAEQALLYPQLPLPAGEEAPPAPDSVTAWFDGLRLLRGLPFNYLVPDERMLPRESIRFFHVDPYWTGCLLDGAFSIGRVAQGEADRESSYASDPSTTSADDDVTGILVRSDVVSGWPGLLVDGTDAAGAALGLLRMDRLANDVLLCLFGGDVASVALHLKPETLHFGLDRNDEYAPADVLTEFHKTLRDADGTEDEKYVVSPVPFRDGGARRVVDLGGLAAAMETVLGLDAGVLTSASFGLQMVEGVEEVVFHRSTPTVPDSIEPHAEETGGPTGFSAPAA